MKNTFLLLLSIAFIKSASAQIAGRNWLAGGNGFYNSTEYDGREKSSTIQLLPNIGYFVLDKFAAGFRGKYQYSRFHLEGSQLKTWSENYHFGPFMRYYFLPTGKNINLLLDGSYLFSAATGGTIGGDSPKITTKSNTFFVSGGPVIFLNNSVGLEFLLNYSVEKYLHVEKRVKTLQLGIGLQVHLEKER